MPKKTTVRKKDIATWPRPVRQAIDAIATTMSALLLLVRTRAAESASPIVRAFAERDALFQDRELLRREADILRSRDADTPPQRRAHYPPESRLAILQLMRLRHWTVEQTAKRFAVHTNTIRHWLKQFNQSPSAPLFTGAAPFNKLSEAAQWLVHEIRALCPEPEFGKPRFLITDHGTQFRSRFRQAVKRMKVALVKGRVRSCQFNGKCERFFRTFRVWQRVTLFAWRIPSIQRKLDSYRSWYNAERAIFGLGCRTPDEIWTGAPDPIHAALPIRENDPVKPALNVHRLHYRGDWNLVQFAIRIVRSVKRSA